MQRMSTSWKVMLLAALVFSSCAEKEGNYIDEVVEKMTLKEKIDFIGGYESFNIRGYDQYSIPEIHMADGPVGVRNFGPSTAYPASICLAASWDRTLANEVGAAIAMEAKSNDVHIMLGPAMNIYRGPFCGRNFEYLGEDPYLAGEIASSYVIGMQDQGVVATAKHYVANFQDYNRKNVSSDMDERTLHEIYLPAFKACVEKGRVGAVMTAYNLINGIHASEHNYLINDVLKGSWGFEGIVMSDWVSTYDGVACAKAGLDLEMPFGDLMNYDTLAAAIESGELDESVIDDKVRRILRLYERFGFFENSQIGYNYKLDSARVRDISRKAAEGGITLLKNEGRVLPVDKHNVTRIAVIGPNGHPAVTGGGGSSYTTPLHPVSLVEALREIAGDTVEISYSQAILKESELPEDFFAKSKFYIHTDTADLPGVSVKFYANKQLEGEAVYAGTFACVDHNLLDSSYAGVPGGNYSAVFETCLKVEESGNYRIAVAGDDGYRLMIDGDTLIDYWYDQPETVRSVDRKLEAGKRYNIKLDYYQGGGHASIRLGYTPRDDMKSEKERLWNEAVKAVKESDFVVFSVGFNPRIETEGMDRSWELPEGQDEMIRKLSALNPNCVVVLNAGGNVGMPWLDDVPALIHAWYPGQEGNLAVAKILFGEINPSGKLPVSFEKKWEDNAAYNSYFDTDKDLRVRFTEGIYLGYRHFDRTDTDPLFPFGFGLSYTDFEYSDLQLDKDTIAAGEQVMVRFKLRNSGKCEGAEVAQLYIRDMESELRRPVKELKGFKKVFLRPEEEAAEVAIMLDKSAFSYYHPEKGGWILEPGRFEIMVGSSSADIRLIAPLEITD